MLFRTPLVLVLYIKEHDDCVFAVTYSDLVGERERCNQCFCCSVCSALCGCAAGLDEDPDHQIYRALGTDKLDDRVEAAELKRKEFVEEEIAEIETETMAAAVTESKVNVT